MEPTNGWSQWKEHVLIELARLNTSIDKVDTKVDELDRKQVAWAAEVRLGRWMIGLLAGALGSVLSFIATIVASRQH